MCSQPQTSSLERVTGSQDGLGRTEPQSPPSPNPAAVAGTPPSRPGFFPLPWPGRGLLAPYATGDCSRFCFWGNWPARARSSFWFSFPGESSSAPKVCRPSLLTFRPRWPSAVNSEQLPSPLRAGSPGQERAPPRARQPDECGRTGRNLVKSRAESGACFGVVGSRGSNPPAACSEQLRHRDSPMQESAQASLPPSALAKP